MERLLDELGQERGVLDAQLVLQKQAVASTRSSFDAITPLVEKGFETKSDYERRRQEWLTTATQLQTLIQQISQLVQRRSQAESELAKLPVEHASKVADLHNSLSELDQRRIDIEGAKSFLITAPVAGRVTAVQAMPGRSSDGRLPMLSIVLEGARMQAILFAPSRAIGMARPGQEVRLMYDAFPYQRFGSSTGRILAISHSVLAPDEVDAPVRLQEPVYEMRVAIEKQSVEAFGQALPLQPGMTLNADVVLDKRSFLDWVLEPLRAVRNRG
ncbi:HlyD family secretion protein [Candidatus Burkholderia verschuerenii]|uniref:HlyD family secretion protein n=1 Tax=Candidatus Burkholderia verschuerenii TaxID=242163 RepID=A0A0L0MG60_9BURK|nr:HlyD family secretion protein [Candidatus Burkholderia verschuerenii]